MCQLFAMDTSASKTKTVRVALRPHPDGGVGYATFTPADTLQLLMLRMTYPNHTLTVDNSSVSYPVKSDDILHCDPRITNSCYRLGMSGVSTWQQMLAETLMNTWIPAIARQYCIKSLASSFEPYVETAIVSCMQSPLLDHFTTQYKYATLVYDTHYQQKAFVTMQNACALYLYELLQNRGAQFKKHMYKPK